MKTSEIEILAARFMKAFNDHDTDQAMSLMCSHPIWEFAIGPHHYGVKHEGVAAVRKAMEETFKKNPDISYETLRTYVSPDSVIYEVLTQSPMNNLKVQSVDIMTFNNDNQITTKRTYRKTVTK